MKPITKHYSNVELTIVWKNFLCKHSGNCVRGLPGVFSAYETPWIRPENAHTDEIIAQVKKCPSGALSYFLNDEKSKQPAG